VIRSLKERSDVSAVEEYRAFGVVIRFGSHVGRQDVDAVAEGVRMLQDKADAAIAELEAERNDIAGLLNAADKQNHFLKAANEQAEAALAAKDEQIAALIADWNKEHPKRLDAEAALAEEKNKTKRQMFALRATDVALANANELIDALDPHGLRRKKMGLRARAEEGSKT